MCSLQRIDRSWAPGSVVAFGSCESLAVFELLMMMFRETGSMVSRVLVQVMASESLRAQNQLRKPFIFSRFGPKNRSRAQSFDHNLQQ